MESATEIVTWPFELLLFFELLERSQFIRCCSSCEGSIRPDSEFYEISWEERPEI